MSSSESSIADSEVKMESSKSEGGKSSKSKSEGSLSTVEKHEQTSETQEINIFQDEFYKEAILPKSS